MVGTVSISIEKPDISQIEMLCNSGYALAMPLLGNREDALEAVQECLSKMLAKPRLFCPERGALKPWFLKMVHNRCIDQLRKKEHQRVEQVPLDSLPSQRQEAPDAIAEEREMLEILKREVLQLPTEHKEMILLRDFHGLSYSEIAEILSLPSGTVMSRLHRARLELQSRMQRYR